MILVVVCSAALLSKEFLLFPSLLPQIKAITRWNGESSAVVLVRMKHSRRVSCSDENSFWELLLLLHPWVPQNWRDPTDSFCFTTGSLLCLCQQTCLWYRLENFSSPQPEHVKSSPVWLKSVHKLIAKSEFTLRWIKSDDNSKNETLTLNLIFLLRLSIENINYFITSCTLLPNSSLCLLLLVLLFKMCVLLV